LEIRKYFKRKGRGGEEGEREAKQGWQRVKSKGHIRAMIIISSHGRAGQSAIPPDYTLLGRGTSSGGGKCGQVWAGPLGPRAVESRDSYASLIWVRCKNKRKSKTDPGISMISDNIIIFLRFLGGGNMDRPKLKIQIFFFGEVGSTLRPPSQSD
jgi:hypothetical protein